MSDPTDKSPHIGFELNTHEHHLNDIARRPALRSAWSALLLGLALMTGVATEALGGKRRSSADGGLTDLGYADVIAPLRAAAKSSDVRAQETLGFMYLCVESRCAPALHATPTKRATGFPAPPLREAWWQPTRSHGCGARAGRPSPRDGSEKRADATHGRLRSRAGQ